MIASRRGRLAFYSYDLRTDRPRRLGTAPKWAECSLCFELRSVATSATRIVWTVGVHRSEPWNAGKRHVELWSMPRSGGGMKLVTWLTGHGELPYEDSLSIVGDDAVWHGGQWAYRVPLGGGPYVNTQKERIPTAKHPGPQPLLYDRCTGTSAHVGGLPKGASGYETRTGGESAAAPREPILYWKTVTAGPGRCSICRASPIPPARHPSGSLDARKFRPKLHGGIRMARTIVVTGGGTGIGKAVAARFAADGDRVVIVGRRAGVLERAAEEIGCTALPADLSEPAQVERLRAALAERFGTIDVLVNNAGGNVEGNGDVAQRWTSNFRANVLTAVLPTEALRELLNPSGRIVFISSIAAYRGSGGTSYGPMKATLHPYAYDLAAALGPRDITVNVVAPGFIEDTEFFAGTMNDDRRAALLAQTHTGRAGTPRDIADTVHWLASPGGGHVTAQVIQVNGGAERGR